MGVNDLMILDLGTLQDITGQTAAKGDSTSEEDASVSLQTETVPDLAKLTEDVPESAPEPEAAAPEQNEPEAEDRFPRRKKREFTLREAAPEKETKYRDNMPMARYSGAGVYSMPVRYSGDGKFEKGRDHPRYKDPDSKPVVIETSEFELSNVESEIERRRRSRRRDDDE